MALSITEVKRKFIFEKGGENIPLTDFDRSLTPEDIVEFYSSRYPELVTSTLEVTNRGDVLEYKAVTALGTKG